MLLVIDAGNTNIAMAVLDNDGNQLGNFRITTKTPRTSDEFGICLSGLLMKCGVTRDDIDEVIVSSVVPKIMHSLNNCIRKYVGKVPLIIGPDIKTGITVNFENPKSVGADRIVNTAYAFHTFKRSCLIIDFGTATTFDYISAEGVFSYTIIAPGIEISAQALYGNTAKLPEIEIKKPDSILATNTTSGMQAGVVYGYIGQVEYIVNQMKKELNDPDMYVIATGGLGRVIYGETDVIDEYDPDIAYKGLYMLNKMNR